MFCARVGGGLSVEELTEAVIASPELFDQIDYRKLPQGDVPSPHRECHDLHLRYNSMEKCGTDGFHKVPHVAEWYPVAKELPQVFPVVESLMQIIGGESLGSVYIFKLPPGKQVYPHVDNSWNSGYFNKYCIGLQCGAGGVVRFEDRSCFECDSGEIWEFDNHNVHSVNNYTDQDWIVMVVNARPISRSYYEIAG